VVKAKDGREFSEYLEYPKGDPREPMTIEDLEAKFNALSGRLLNADRQNEVKKTIFDCEKMQAVDFMSSLIV
jgi:2-methylcitrate dehydratase